MAEQRVLGVSELAEGAKRTVKVGETEVLLLRHAGDVVALQAKCPHAGAPLEKGAVCNGRLVCPWHMGTFALPGGGLVEPPPMQDLKRYAVREEGDGIFVDPERVVAGETAAKDGAVTGQGAEAGGRLSLGQLGDMNGAEEDGDTRTFLLVGAGAAGAMAATTLRMEGFRGRIVVVDPVAEEPVDRTQLSKMALSGKTPLEKVRMPTLDVQKGERITARVVELSAARREVVLDNGRTVRFDEALVATGGVPKRLEVPGAERAHVIRHTGDVKRILDAVEGKKTVAIVGGSFIALEAASALVEKGLEVTVLAEEQLPFAKKFGDAAAEAVMALHREKGTKFRLGVETVRVEGDAVVVRGKDGGAEERVPAEVVVFGVGVEPVLVFVHDLPLAEKGGGVAVSAGLEAAPYVWVAGDVANVDGVRIEHWRLAEQHGRVAAMAMLGRAAKFEGVPFFWTFHFGKRLGYLGHAEAWDEIVTEGDFAGFEFLSMYVKGGVVKAVLGCGRDTAMAGLAEVMRGEVGVAEVRRVIAAA